MNYETKEKKDHLVLKIALGIMLGFTLMGITSFLLTVGMIGGISKGIDTALKNNPNFNAKPNLPNFNAVKPTQQLIQNLNQKYTAPLKTITYENQNSPKTINNRSNGTARIIIKNRKCDYQWINHILTPICSDQ